MFVKNFIEIKMHVAIFLLANKNKSVKLKYSKSLPFFLA